MSTRASRLRRWAIIVASAFTLYLIVGFFVLPPIVRSQIIERVGTALDREVVVERVRMNPLSFAIAVHGVRVIDRDGADLASWREIYVNADPLISLAKLEWHLREFRLVDPRQRIVIDEQGQANIADLIAKFAPSDADAPPPDESRSLPKAAVDELRIERWAVDFTDRSRRTPFRTELGPMTFTVDRFTTRADTASPYTFAGTTEAGETFSWSGRVSAVPLGSQGHIEFAGFSLPKHMPLVEHLFAGSLPTGRVSFRSDYRIVLAETPVMELTDASVAVDELSVAERGAADALVKLAHLQVDIPRADGVARTAEVSRVALDGLEVYAAREPGGAIDLLRLLPTPEEAGPATAATQTEPSPSAGPDDDTGPAPSVHVAEVVVSNGRISVVDRSHPRTARILLDQVSLTAKNLGTDLDREVDLEMSARWNEHGSLSAVGTVRPLPMAARVQLRGGQVTLPPLDPLLESFADVRIKSGEVWFAGTLEASLAPGGSPQVAWQGDFGLDDLSVCEGRHMTELAGWKRLAFTGTEFQLEPLALVAREIAWIEPTASVTRLEDGSINLLAVLHGGKNAEEPAPASTPVSTGPATPGTTSERLAAATQRKLDFAARIDAVRIEGGRFQFTDQSLKPEFSTELRDFAGSIRGLSSENLARADVDLTGSLDGVAPLRVSGQINPLAEDRYSDVSILFSNIDLPMFSPYSGRFIGQKIQKGKLRVDVGYKLSQRELVGENNVLFDQFYLGEKVASEEAMKLPIGLALALLRDRNGQIRLDVPVRGNLDDPEFKYGRVVWRTIGNIVVKAATSPFSMLGGMFGGRDLDLSTVDFAPGSDALTDEARQKLDVLTKALFERPALRLEITAPPSPEADREALVAAHFDRMLREEKQRLAHAPGTGDAAVPVENAPGPLPDVSADEVNALVASLFAARFPAEAEQGAAAAAAAGVTPIVAPLAGEEERPGFLRRTWRRIFGGGGADSATAAVEAPAPAAPAAAEGGAAAEPLTLERMRDRLLATIEVSGEEIAALSRARAVAVRDALVGSGKVEAERVFVLDSTTVPEGAVASVDAGRVFFNLQ